jgi:glycosyltransferase involved in cell wall biosynthesis
MRPDVQPVDRRGHVALVMPTFNEAGRVGSVIARLPPFVLGLRTTCVVIDDGSTDDTVAEALSAGAKVVRHQSNMGLGAAIRTGLRVAVEDGSEIIAFCDGDGEYAPEELERLVAPILEGTADYVVGSRFTGTIRRMSPHRRLGNVLLTRWVRWMTRRPLTDGQSGYRALSRAAAIDADVIHDYNYAQVMTLDLLAKGFEYGEVPISYEFRADGTSFVRLGAYLRHVVPTTVREIRAPSFAATQSSATAQSSTT